MQALWNPPTAEGAEGAPAASQAVAEAVTGQAVADTTAS
jgi:hypothetical protein